MILPYNKYKVFVVITLNNVRKVSGSNYILKDVSFKVSKGEVIGLVGPSGSGKSTLLRCMAGLETYSSGEIIKSTDCRIGMVFQSFNIFKNMSVIRNLSYPQQKILGRTKNDADGISLNMLRRFNIMHLFNRHHDQLSGGQKQRVAIARTLCLDPSVILFDEPTSSLDPENVLEVLSIIKEIATDHISIVIVSHELRFIESIANRVLFINNGEIEVDCDTKAFFRSPSNKRLQGFLEAFLRY